MVPVVGNAVESELSGKGREETHGEPVLLICLTLVESEKKEKTGRTNRKIVTKLTPNCPLHGVAS